MNIVNVGYDSTNYYVLADTRPRLLIDVGWPGTLPKLQHQCQRMDISLADIQHFMITHYHPDHASLAQELKRLGCQLIVLESQVTAVPLLSNQIKSQDNYVPIDLKDTIRLSLNASRAFLAQIGLQGEIISTPGHSDDSVTVILDEGRAFTGDLTHPLAIGDDATLRQSWERIRARGVKTVYPGHGPVWHLE